MFQPDCTEFGTIVKSHTHHCVFIITLKNPVDGKFKIPDFLFIETEGCLIPFQVEESEIKSENIISARFCGINERENSIKFIGSKVFIERKYFPVSETHPITSVQGFMVYNDKGRKTGKVTNLLDIKDNPLLEINIGNKEILIPFNIELIVKIDVKKKKIFLKIAEGLLTE